MFATHSISLGRLFRTAMLAALGVCFAAPSLSAAEVRVPAASHRSSSAPATAPATRDLSWIQQVLHDTYGVESTRNGQTLVFPGDGPVTMLLRKRPDGDFEFVLQGPLPESVTSQKAAAGEAALNAAFPDLHFSVQDHVLIVSMLVPADQFNTPELVGLQLVRWNNTLEHAQEVLES